MKTILLLATLLFTLTVSPALAAVYSGVMDNRAGQQFIPGMTGQSKAWTSGGNPGEGVRLEWQVDNVNTPGAWTYSYRLLRGTAKNKGFAFFDIETAGDFTAANILSRQVVWASDRLGNSIPSGLAAVTISDPVNFNAVHDFSNAAVTEKDLRVVLDKFDLSHYSGDPGRVAPGVPGGDASYTPSVGPVPHPFYGVRVTFPGSFSDLAYEASEWEFRIVSDRPPMWGSCFGWGDQTFISPYWYSNFYSNNIDNSVRLALPPADNIAGTAPYQGWLLVPGPLPAAQPSLLSVDLATYSRGENGTGEINLFATARPNANLTVSGNGISTPVVMTKDTPNPAVFGKFLAQIPYSVLPSSVTLDNSLDPVEIPPYQFPLVDEVNITQAVYNPQTRTMTIKAASRDRMAPLPVLTAVDFAAPNNFDASGAFVKILTANPPNKITVISSKGGAATATVSLVTQPAAPAAADDLATTAINTPVTVAVLANDTTSGILDPASVQISTPAVNGLAVPTPSGTIVFMPNAGFNGTATFTYTVKDTFSQISNAATVTITVGTPPGALTIIATAAANGTISPSGTTTVAPGADQAYTITPNAGFTVTNLVVDGTLLPGATSYTFTNVTADHYINAYFGPMPANVTITAAAGPNGSVSPLGATSVAWGTDQTFTITPNDGFIVTALVVDGISLSNPNTRTFTFGSVTSDHYVNVYFGPPPATVSITAAAAPNGSISPAGVTAVPWGANQTYTITPDAGFSVASLVVDGTLLPGATSFTFTNVDGDHYINAYFSP